MSEKKQFDPRWMERAERARNVGYHPAFARLVGEAFMEHWKLTGRHPEVWAMPNQIERLPEGAYVAAVSHSHLDDIPAAKAFLKERNPKYVAKIDLGSNVLKAGALTMMGAEFLVRPEDSREYGNWDVVKERMGQHLATGEPVIIFPEGTRHERPELGKIHGGAADLAVSFNVPVVPIGLANTHVKGSAVAGWIGETIEPMPYENEREKLRSVAQMNRELKTALPEAYDQAYEFLARQTGLDVAFIKSRA